MPESAPSRAIVRGGGQQFAAGRHLRAPCVGALEAELYALQARFLRSRQQPRDAVLFDIVGLLQAAGVEHLR